MPKSANEKRQLKVHARLIFDVITMQAGTLAKAIQEGVQNSYDAGATRCDVSLTSREFVITDDGRGFASRDDIERFFETFGTPHEEPTEQDGRLRYGRFRMGRGQMFSFAKTTYTTGNFVMTVDIKRCGLDYDLGTLAKAAPGCTVSGALYDPLAPSELLAATRDVQEAVKYFPIPVTLNGEVISTPAGSLKWDTETEDAYINFKSGGGVCVYNAGVLVRTYSEYEFGISAIVISKKLLEVNFARNDILVAKCAVWKRIRKELQKHSASRAQRAATLTEGGRATLLKRFLAGEMPVDEFITAKVFRHAQRGYLSLSQILNGNLGVCVASADGDRAADRIHEQKLATVLSPQVLEWTVTRNMGHLVDKLCAALQAGIARDSRYSCRSILERLRELPLVDYSRLAAQIDSKVRYLKSSQLTASDLALLKALRCANIRFYRLVSGNDEFSQPRRRIAIGEFGDALGWTDGQVLIGVSLRHLRHLRAGVTGAFQVVMTLAHEYAHLSSDAEDSHVHDEEFHRRYYAYTDRCAGQLAECAVSLASEVCSRFTKAGLTIPRGALRDQDRAFAWDLLDGYGGDEPAASEALAAKTLPAR